MDYSLELKENSATSFTVHDLARGGLSSASGQGRHSGPRAVRAGRPEIDSATRQPVAGWRSGIRPPETERQRRQHSDPRSAGAQAESVTEDLFIIAQREQPNATTDVDNLSTRQAKSLGESSAEAFCCPTATDACSSSCCRRLPLAPAGDRPSARSHRSCRRQPGSG